MGGMSRSSALVLGSLLVVSVGCRRMEAMDLHGPDGGDQPMDGSSPDGAPPASDPANKTAANTPSKPAGTSSTSTTNPRAPTTTRPPRKPTSGGTASAGGGGDPESGRLAGITAAHNAVRSPLGVPALTWAPEVAKFAQAWADKLKGQGCALKHRPHKGADAQKFGENVYSASGSAPTAGDVVDTWAAEVADYNAKTNRCKGVCGHYTQVVWRKSQRLGCGMASCGETEVWVCNYDPPGNFMGERPY
jgi:pathogenesis-related protein 1